VLPIATPEEMRRIDEAAASSLATLVGRAGHAVAHTAIDMLGGTYGRRVVVVAGRGNNGADGRVAAEVLRRRGAHVHLFDVGSAPALLPRADLVIDAAFGTGFRGEWTSPRPVGGQVLAVDIPSGVDGLTGSAGPGVLPADRTVTFAALKPGLLFHPGAALAGRLELVDIGLDVSGVAAHLVQHRDVAGWWQPRRPDAHKWRSGMRIVAGSPGMLGAAHLTSSAAMRAGAGIVHLSSPGVVHDPVAPTEAVLTSLPSLDWAVEVLTHLDRFAALAVGPGLGRDDHVAAQVRRLVVEATVPAVVDGDALFALAWHPEGAAKVLRRRSAPTVLTPHDGEFALLTGSRPGADRIAAARRLAADAGAVVLLKGPATVVAEPFGEVLVVTAGDQRLATAGSGDVLTGIVGALLAQGLPAFHAAAAGAWIHGQAARRGPAQGLVAHDLVELLPAVLDLLV
jgi:NAD(P)H-hydrate epimerase